MKNSDSHVIDEQNRHGLLADIAASLAFLTRLPISNEYVRKDIATAVRGFGIVGIVVGAFCGVTFWLATSLGISSSIAAILSLAIGFLITGGLHEDGLGDVADGFGGGWTPERKLEIMHDSAIGTYGMLALIVFVTIRALGISQLVSDDASIIQCLLIFAGIGCLSRTPMILMMRQVSLARKDGRAADAGKPSGENTKAGIALGGLSSFMLFWFSLGFAAALIAAIACVFAYVIVKRLTINQIGGYTGDVLGFLQQLSELFMILAILTVA